MDVTDALRRIVMRHLVLIAIATLIPVIGFSVYKAIKPTMYTASTQVLVADRSATSAQAATAQADTAIAKVTAIDTITAALKEAGINHDALDYQQNDLSAAQVLTSPEIKIDAKWTDRQGAVNIAGALADQTIHRLYDPVIKPLKDALDEAKANLDAANTRLTAAQVAVAKAGVAATTAQTIELNQAFGAQAEAAKDYLKAKNDYNTTFVPSVSDVAKIVPATTLSKIQPYVLVFFVGLILGVGIAAVVESIAPSVVGASGISGLFGAPYLGYAVGRGGKVKGRITDLALAARLHAAARRVGADTVVIAGDVRCDLPDLAGRLDALLGGATNQQIHGTVPGQTVEANPTGAPDPAMLNQGEGSKELATRQASNAPALFSERLSFGEDIPSVWVHPRVVPYDEQVLLLLSTAPVSVAVAVVGAPKGKRKNLTPAIELVETSGWEILGTILADATRKPGTV